MTLEEELHELHKRMVVLEHEVNELSISLRTERFNDLATNDILAKAYERIDSLDKLTQGLYRMIKMLKEEPAKRPPLPYWSDLPR